MCVTEPANRSSGNTFVTREVGLRFKSRAGQIGHSFVNGSPPLRHFFERSCVARRRNDVEMGVPTRYTLWRKTA